MMNRERLVVGLAAVVLLLETEGCGPPPAPPEPSREARAQAAQIFAKRCAECHGPLGKGDGPRAHTLRPPPRNFADPVWQLAISDKHLEQVILNGGPSVGKSKEMPANPELANNPEVLMALRQHVRVLAYAP
jgi:mono/diheme cytochrome c family protein